jgi:phage repressor protein C with HTH and peptisase S24 domain
MELKDRVVAARVEAGYKTQEDLAAAIGCTRAAVTQWENGTTLSIGQKHLLRAARVLNVNAEWLQFGRGPKRPNAKVAGPLHAYEVAVDDGGDGFDQDAEAWIDDVEVSVAAGYGRIVPEFVPTRYRQRYRLAWFAEKGVKPSNVKTMRVHGDSMERTLFDGDKVAVDFGQQSILNGRVYVCAIGEEVRVKRLFKLADGRIRISSDNADKNMYPDEIVAPADAESFAILGRVIDRSGDGGL